MRVENGSDGQAAMRIRVFEKVMRSALIRAEVFVNRLLNREFIPVALAPFNIETSSACNLKCRFCAYEKKLSPKVSMKNEMFFDCVRQAIGLGYTEFHLTPCTGDVFMDRHVFEKFAFLDDQPELRAYHFFTNWTILSRDQILRLMTLKKLQHVTVSVYGHDEKTFLAITKSTPKVYRRLIANLETLLANLDRLPFGVSIGFRSTFDVPSEDSSDLMRLLSKFRKAGVAVRDSHGIYNNWGGYISQEDVADLEMHILPADLTSKSGACVKLFDSVQVMATGIVNGCSCRDVDATLQIGDVQELPLEKIMSAKNAQYLQIIEEQQAGKFRPVCKSCDYYRSIYHQPKNYRRDNVPTQGLRKFLSAR
jgi:MoaA/NifB/PqqE/SkfB family radical SAM enzyme